MKVLKRASLGLLCSYIVVRNTTSRIAPMLGAHEKQAARMAGRLVQACDKCMHSGEKTLTGLRQVFVLQSPGELTAIGIQCECIGRACKVRVQLADRRGGQ
jgi:hypothetical protein